MDTEKENEIKIHKLLNWISESILKIGAASAELKIWPYNFFNWASILSSVQCILCIAK